MTQKENTHIPKSENMETDEILKSIKQGEYKLIKAKMASGEDIELLMKVTKINRKSKKVWFYNEETDARISITLA